MEYDWLILQHRVTGHDKNAIHLFNMIFTKILLKIQNMYNKIFFGK